MSASSQDPKRTVTEIAEGGGEFVCTHPSHSKEKGARFVIKGDHQKYQEHLRDHGKKQLGSMPCSRCGKPVDLSLRPVAFGTKGTCEDCLKYYAQVAKDEGLLQK